jgi:integrase
MALRRVHVWERDGRYYWRVRLPRRLAPRLGRAVIAWSLGTREPREARQRAARATAAFETFVSMLDQATPRRQPTDAELMEVLRAIFDDIVLGRESINAAVLSPAEMAEEGIASDELTPEEIAILDREHDEQSAATWKTYLDNNDLRQVGPLVERYLADKGLAPPNHFHLHRTLLHMALRVVVKAKEVIESRGDPDAFPYADRHTPTRIAAMAVDDLRLATLEEAFTAHAERKKERGGWGRASLGKARVAFRLWNALMPSLPSQEIARRHAVAFRDKLDRVPVDWAKASLYRGLPLPEVIAKADRLEKALAAAPRGQASIPFEGRRLTRRQAERLTLRLHPKTINNHMDFFAGLMNRLIQEGTHLGPNPFLGLRYGGAEIARLGGARKARIPWEPEHLARLFSSPLWTGCRSPERRHLPGRMVIEDGWWWAPFLALFAGLRAEEALQLRSDDITEARGVPVIRVAWHEDARRKTASARRLVPIHAELIRLGLLDFAAAARERGSRLLFPEMPRGKARDSLSAYFSRRFADLRRRLDLPDACDFHAFRTTFITTVEGLPTTNTTLVDSTVGHKPRREMAAHYAKLGPQHTRALIDSVDFGIDLSHLHVRRQKRIRPFLIHPSRRAEQEGTAAE